MSTKVCWLVDEATRDTFQVHESIPSYMENSQKVIHEAFEWGV
jgi:hypothetical protein